MSHERAGDAVIQAAGGIGEPGEAAEQLALLPLPIGEPAPAPRQAGRPKGALSHDTRAWLRYLGSKGYRSPLEVWAEAISRPAAELAKELGCSRLEAFDRQLRAADSLAPYVHQRMPQAVHVETDGPLVQNSTAIVVSGSLEPALVEMLAKQGLTVAGQGQVGRAELDVSPNSQLDQSDSASNRLIAEQRTGAPGDPPGGEVGRAGPIDGAPVPAPPRGEDFS